jgi:hypothetical protein
MTRPRSELGHSRPGRDSRETGNIGYVPNSRHGPHSITRRRQCATSRRSAPACQGRVRIRRDGLVRDRPWAASHEISRRCRPPNRLRFARLCRSRAPYAPPQRGRRAEPRDPWLKNDGRVLAAGSRCGGRSCQYPEKCRAGISSALRLIEARAIARPPTTSRVAEITLPCRI